MTNKRGADDKNDGGLVTVKRQRQTPKGAVSSTTRKNIVSELSQESKQALSTPRQARNNPPAQGWELKRVEESNRLLYHWISPTRKIEFKRHKQAREFEDLRFRYGPNEVLAWEEYRKLKYGQKTFVVTPHLYDHSISTKKVNSCRQGGCSIGTVARNSEMYSDNEDVDSCYICDDGGGT